MLSTLAAAAPVPKAEPPDPLGRGYMGVYSKGGDQSLEILRIAPDSPASRAGLQDNDRFLQVGPLKATNFEEVRQFIMTLRPGTRVNLLIQRGETRLNLFIELAVKVDTESLEPVFPPP